MLASNRGSIKASAKPADPLGCGGSGAACMVQAAGHAKTFKRDPESPGTVVIKEGTANENTIYESLQAESLRCFTPNYHGAVERGAITLLRLGDVTAGCSAPCVLDLKLGTRTFVEAETSNPKRRLDLAKKIAELDPGELSQQDKKEGVTKLRYMQFRDQSSSSASLGFRVEGMRVGSSTVGDCKRLRTRAQLAAALQWYVGGCEALRRRLLGQLRALRTALEESEWVSRHELIGVSLLFVYDADAWEHGVREPAHPPADEPTAGEEVVRMIDFAKVVPLDAGRRLTHRDEWQLGNREDGFLMGLDELINLWEGALETLCDGKAWSRPGPEKQLSMAHINGE